jgi:hypothetical protein
MAKVTGIKGISQKMIITTSPGFQLAGLFIAIINVDKIVNDHIL